MCRLARAAAALDLNHLRSTAYRRVGRVAKRSGILYVARGFVFTAQQWSPAALSVTIDSVLVRDPEPKAADLDGGVVVLSVRAGSYFGFNRVATEIWNMLAEPCRVGQIFESLHERHEVDAETLSRDVTPFLQTLVEQQLVRLVDPGDVPSGDVPSGDVPSGDVR